MIGNGRVISRWPLRSGVAVRDGTVYFSAGMWPSEGIFVYALSVADGQVVWKNDTGLEVVRDVVARGVGVQSTILLRASVRHPRRGFWIARNCFGSALLSRVPTCRCARR